MISDDHHIYNGMKGVTVLYTVWRFGSRKENKGMAKLI
jgi:PII-like signaling protein